MSNDMISESARKRIELKANYQRFVGKKVLFLVLLVLGILALAGVVATLGSADVSVTEVYSTVMAKFFPGHFQTTWFADTIVWGLRLHRIMMAIVGGMGLAIAGAVMQGILKNPLASPFTLGIASAASFGAALANVLGAGFMG